MAVVVFGEGFETAGVFRNDFDNAVGLARIKLVSSGKSADDSHHVFDVVEFFDVLGGGELL